MIQMIATSCDEIADMIEAYATHDILHKATGAKIDSGNKDDPTYLEEWSAEAKQLKWSVEGALEDIRKGKLEGLWRAWIYTSGEQEFDSNMGAWLEHIGIVRSGDDVRKYSFYEDVYKNMEEGMQRARYNLDDDEYNVLRI